MTTTATASSGAGSSRKVSRLLELQLDDEFLQGLQCIDAGTSATSGNNNNNASFLSVKGIAEQQVLASYEELLTALGEADRRYLDVADSVATLAAEGAKAREVLGKCAAASGELLAKIDGLVAELAEVQQREQRIGAFIRSFQILDEDAVTLRQGEVSPEFLAALTKLQRIHDSCKAYAAASAESEQLEQQQAAVEVMESTFLLHMGAMEKLAAYVANTAPEVCGGSSAVLDSSTASSSSQGTDHAMLLVDAVRALQSNPSMWAKAVHEIARVRRGALLRRLASHTAQLVRESNARLQQQQQQQGQRRGGGGDTVSGSSGGGGGAAGTFSVNSTSLRLLGDLCAWLDETAAEENDSAAAFFFASSTASPTSSSTMVGRKDSLFFDAAGEQSDSVRSHHFHHDQQQQQQRQQPHQLTSSTSAYLTLPDYLDAVFDAAARQLKLRAIETVNEMSEAVWPRVSSLSAGGSGSSGSSSGAAASNGSGAASAAASVAAGPISILADSSKVHALVALYKTESLFSFYATRVAAIFGPASSVVAALNDARLESMRLFYELLSGLAGAVRQVIDSSSGSSMNNDALPEGLVPHPSVSASCGLLRALLHVIETSPAPQAQRLPEAAPLLSALLDPVTKMIESSSNISDAAAATAAATSSLPAQQQDDAGFAVYAINTLCVALSSVLPFDFTAQRQQSLTDLLEASVLRYIRLATARTSERLELDVALKLISQTPRPTRDSAALAMKVFFAAIFAGEGVCPLPVPHLELIQPVRVRERCRKEIVAQVCATYDRIYEIVSHDIEPDADGRKLILHHTPEKLRLLLE